MSAPLLAKKGVSDAPHPAVSLATHQGSILRFREWIIERSRAALPAHRPPLTAHIFCLPLPVSRILTKPTAHIEQLTSFSSVKIRFQSAGTAIFILKKIQRLN